jgi:nucleotide-binding universal stress UspA family protein
MKILMPIDGSDCATKTLHWAAKTFNPETAEYYLLFVIPVLPDLNTVEYDIMDASAILKRAKAELEDKGCKVISAEYVLGDAVDQICRYAEEIDADQLILGSHGRTGLAKLMMGSTSIRVLEHCRRPVTIHRNVEKRSLRVVETHPEHKTPHIMPGNTVL